LEFRLATHNDIPAIISMKIAMFNEADVELGVDHQHLITLYHDYYDKKSAFHYITEKDGCVVAMAGGFLKNDFPFCLYPNPVYGFIGDVFVAPDFRRQGHARILSSKVIQKLKQNSVNSIRLLASHAARPLYEQLGFKQADMMEMEI